MAAYVQQSADPGTGGTTNKVPATNVIPPLGFEDQTRQGTPNTKLPTTLSVSNPKLFKQQVQRAIVESIHTTKAQLGRQLLEDQLSRVESTQPLTQHSNTQNVLVVPSNTHKLGSTSISSPMSSLLDQTKKGGSAPIGKLRYTPSGRKLQDTSIQAVMTQDGLQSASSSVANTGAGSRLRSYRSLRGRHKGQSSPQDSQRGNWRLDQAVNVAKDPYVGEPRQISAAKTQSKLIESSISMLGSQLTIGSNVVRGAATPKSTSSLKIPLGVRPLAEGSMKTFVGSRLFQPEPDYILDSKSQFIPEGASSKEASLLDQKPAKTPSGGNIGTTSSIKTGISKETSTPEEPTSIFNLNIQSEPDKLKIGTSQERSPSVRYTTMKQPLNLLEAVQSHWKYMSTNSKTQQLTPGAGSVSAHQPQLKASELLSFTTSSTKRSSQRSSVKKSLQDSPQQISVSSNNQPVSQERSAFLADTDSLVEKMLKYCHCPDVEVPGEDKLSELKFDFDTFKTSYDDLAAPRPKIMNVTRSPFERKDRAARAAFVKELEQMEIAAIEKKQRVKPKKIKRHLKKAGVYETIKQVCRIPDSFADSMRGTRSNISLETGASQQISARFSHSDSGGCPSQDSSLIGDKLQLRKDNSLGSRNTGGELNREEAFHEIELSDESEMSHRSIASSSSSTCELISSSSEISLRVNLDKTLTSEEQKARKLKAAPFVNYQNKINGEKVLKDGHKAKLKILDTNLEGIIIEKIATEFGEWAKENGVKPEAVEKDVIKELFQFGTMDTAANSIAVEIKELIIVPETITKGVYPELEDRAAMYRQILFDEVAYWRTERTMAFGKPDPHPYKRPPHPPLPTWTQSGFVPQPLATGELLYQTLIDNDSLMLERYVLWMIENPKHYRPPYLLQSGYLQKVVDKHGGSEEAIRHKSALAKTLAAQAGKNMAGLNFGMQNDLRKLKEMSEAGKKNVVII